jgi:hypothetical protein
MRLMGEPDEIARTLHELGQVFDVAYDGRTYPQRGGFGVRAYVEVRLPPASTVRVDQIHPDTPEIDQ